MKRAIFILMFLPAFLMSQNYDADTLQFKFGSQPNTFRALSPILPEFSNNKFKLYYCWSGDSLIQEATHSDLIQCTSWGTDNGFNYPPNRLLLRNTPGISCNDQEVGALQSMAAQYDARLTIDPGIEFNSLPNDALQSVFGFINTKGSVAVDYRVFDSTANYVDNGFILSNNWPGNIAIHTEQGDGHDTLPQDPPETKLMKRNLNGEWWYLSINLGRYYDNDLTSGAQPVISLKVKYVTVPDYNNGGIRYSGYIYFDSIPAALITDTASIIDSRGRSRGLLRKLIPGSTNEIIITRNMLPKGTNRDITISARFVCDETINPFLRNKANAQIPPIDSLLIETTYHGHNSIRCRWVKFETPHAQNLFRGAYDQDIRSFLQWDLNHYDDPSFVNRGIKIWRFWGRDEFQVEHFHAMRYFNKLIGGLAFTSHGDAYLKQLSYHIGMQEEMTSMPGFGDRQAAPYFRKGNRDNGSLGYFEGSWGNASNGIFKDSLSSRYETSFWDGVYYNMSNISSTNINTYSNWLDSSHSTQAAIEKWIYSHWVQSSKVLYSGNNLFGYGFIGSNWGHDDNIPPRCWNQYIRPKTGEEIRYILDSYLIFGAKGYGFDRDVADPFPYGFQGISKWPVPRVGIDTILQSDIIGGDWLKNNHPSNLEAYINKHYVDSVHLIGDTNRIYIGWKSSRLEIKKIMDLASVIDTTLMNLRLCAWYGKGYRVWAHQDTATFGSTNILAKYIDPTMTLTRPIGRMKDSIINGQNLTVPYFEQETVIDSGFYDLTLLRDSRKNIDSTFYIGVQSRRTDPLIHSLDIAYNSNGSPVYDNSMKFYSSAEFDKFIQIGGLTTVKVDTGYYFQPAPYWQNLWWRRLGSRQITLKFNFQSPYDPGDYCLLRVRELGSDNTTLNTQPWRQEPYHHIIDTVIGSDTPLEIALLPGDGTILRCDVLYTDKSPKGDLTHSNQSKLVYFPVLDKYYQETNSVRYHLTYHRLDSTKINHVYYRRSRPVSKDSPDENIVWEQEVDVSNQILLADQHHIMNTVPCDYPSIVVRFDSTSQRVKAYIVYACDGSEISTDGFIGETILNVDSSVVISQYGRILCPFFGTDRKEWGTPVINASGNGNYYAWADSSLGIVAAWKKSSDTLLHLFRDTCQISYYRTFRPYPDHPPENPPDISVIAQHPSLNVYSAIKVDTNPQHTEDNCALVWQEYLYDEKLYEYTNQICYTRLRMTDTSDYLKFYLTKTFDQILSDPLLNSDTTILIASMYEDRNNCFPVVHRFLDDYPFVPWDANRCDKIYWQLNSTFMGRPSGSLETRSLFLRDSANVPMGWYIYNPTHIYSYPSDPTSILSEPNVSHGSTRHTISNQLGNQIILAYHKYDASTYPVGNEICQIPHDWNTFLGTGNYQDDSFTSQVVRYYGGQPHLAKAMKRVVSPQVNFKNRMIYEIDAKPPYTLETSAKHYYRTNAEDEPYDCMVGFRDSSNRYLITLPKLNNSNNLRLNLPFNKIEDAVYGDKWVFVKRDTIFSDWFSVGNNTNLKIKAIGNNTTLYQSKIQRQSNNQVYNLSTATQSRDTAGVLNNFTLINGGNNQYRLLFINTNRQSNYFEEVYLGGLHTASAINRENDDEVIVDLGEYNPTNPTTGLSISLFPNPAEDRLYITVYNPLSSNNLILKVYSQMGAELMRQDATTGQTVSINTSQFPVGTYFIRAEEKEWSAEAKMTMQSFIINR